MSLSPGNLRSEMRISIYAFVFGCFFSLGSPINAQSGERTPPAFTPPQKQQVRPQNIANPRTPNRQQPPRAAAAPQTLPNPFQLTAGEKQHLDQVLGYWQGRSGKVKTYECEFTRWEYDSVFGPTDPRMAKTKADGRIRYAAPDKGEFKVESIGEFNPAQLNPPQKFNMKPSDHDEHWICDGRSVFELNGTTKTLREERLPPEMQGQSITAGPLPFMFGAKKDELLARYWMKEIMPPKERKGEYWIEARPKFRDDAANFQKIIVILDEKNFLPVAMQVFPPTWDGKNNWSRSVYAFSNRTFNNPLQLGQKFLGFFISPKVPRGWKKVVNNLGVPPRVTPQAPAGAPGPPMNATAPKNAQSR